MSNSRNRRRQKRPTLVTQQSQPLQGTMEEKVNPAFSGLVSFMDMPQPHTSPKNYKTYMQEGYKGESTLFKVINYIITNGAAIPPVLYTDKTRTKEIKSHPLLDKLERPNIEQNGVNYRKSVLGHFLVTGNSFQYAIRKGTIGPPDELWTLQPDKIKILPTKKRGIVGYEFEDFDGSATSPVAGQNPIPFQNIGHLKTWNPDDPLWGLSPIEVGAIMVDMQLAYKKWNLGTVQNGGKMSGYFTTPLILDGNVRQKTEDKINDKYAGPRNAGRIGLLDGGLTFTNGSLSPNDLDWLKAIQYNAGSLANLYNILPQLIGDTGSTTYDNMDQAKAASYTEEIFPVLDEMYALDTMWLVPMYSDLCDGQGNPVACLYYDKETVEVVQSVIQAKMTAVSQRANAAFLAGNIMLDEARDILGLPPLPKKAGQVFRIGTVLVNLDDIAEYAEQSLKTPAAAPALVPENLLNVPPGGTLPVPANPDDPKKPAPAKPKKPGANNDKPDDNGKPAPNANDNTANGNGKSHTVLPGVVDMDTKSLDASGTYQPDNLDEQLAAYKAAGVTHVMWKTDLYPCDVCIKNEGKVVTLGEPFPSGHILSPAHPHCDCTVMPVSFTNSEAKPKSIEDARERKKKAEAFKAFKEATV